MGSDPKLDRVSILPQDADDRSLEPRLRNALAEARDYIGFYKWVGKIEEQYLAVGIEGIIDVFLFKIKPRAIALIRGRGP